MTPAWREVLERARDWQRHVLRQMRDGQEKVAQSRSRLHRIAEAAVDNLEMFERLAPTLRSTSKAAEVVDSAIETSRAQLEMAGIILDGAVGERLDTRRHKVIRESRGDRASAGQVIGVIQRGIVIEHERVRPAAVAIASETESND